MKADWTFESADIARDFDNHVREQLPWYDLATGAIAHVARHYIPQNGLVYDIGASTGNVGRALEKTLKSRDAELIAIEPSAEMVKAYAGPGDIVQGCAEDFDYEEFDVAICFLTLMFVPVARRRYLLTRLLAHVRPGGALIIFDKVDGPGGYLSTVMHRLTIAGKVAQGADAKAVIEKELSLMGIQRPLPDEFIKSVRSSAVEIFRFGEFVGWVIEGE